MTDEPRATMTADQIAHELHHSRDWFYRVRAQLEAEGFPKPLPLPARRRKGQADGRSPRIWSREAVMEWIRNPRPLPGPANDDAPQRAAPRRDRELLARRLV